MTNSHSDQIENRGEDGYGKSVGYSPLKDEFHRIYPFLNSQTSREEIFTIFLPNSSKNILEYLQMILIFSLPVMIQTRLNLQ